MQETTNEEDNHKLSLVPDKEQYEKNLGKTSGIVANDLKPLLKGNQSSKEIENKGGKKVAEKIEHLEN